MISTTPRKVYAHWLKNFSLINVAFFYLIAIVYLCHMPTVVDPLCACFAFFGYFGQIGLLYLFTLIPVGLLLLIYPHVLSVIIAATLIATLIQLLMIADAFTFLHYSYHINLIFSKVIFSSHMIEFFGLSTAEAILCYSLALTIIIGEGILAWILWIKRHSFNFKFSFVLFIILVIGCTLISQGIYIYAFAFGKQFVIQNSRAFPGYRGIQGNDFLIKHHFFTKDQVVTQIVEAVNATRKEGFFYPLAPLQDRKVQNPLNIVLIGIDAWRADALEKKATPNIYSFSEHASRFYNHYSGGNCTLSGIYTLYYSIPSSYWDASNVPPVIFHELNKYHYRQGVFFSAGLFFPDFYRNVFSTVKHVKVNVPENLPYIRDNVITEAGLKFLDRYKLHKQPFFLFLFYDAAHSYSSPNDFQKLFQPEFSMDRSKLTKSTPPLPYLNNYKNALYYDDSLVGKVLTKLKTMGLDKNTIVIITSDHGEEFNDNHQGSWGHSSNFTQYQTKIPLIIYWPGKSPQQIYYRTSHYDVMPTLLQDAFKVQNPTSDYSIGNNLFAHKSWKILPVGSYSYQGLITPPYIYNFYPVGVTAVLDMHARLQTNFPVDAMALKNYLQATSRFYRENQ